MELDLSSFGEWQPIGTSSNPFTGSFDGGDFKIAGLTITIDDGTPHIGLFGSTENAVLQNIHLRDVQIDVTGSHTGSIVGALSGWMIQTTVRNVSVTGMVRSNDFATGGIAGVSIFDSLSDSYSTADVSGAEYAGGLIGLIEGTTIERSYATGHVTGQYVGGIGGYSDGAVIVDSHATGNVTSTHAAGVSGGLIGEVLLNIMDTEVRNSYALGKVEGGMPGGVAGKKKEDFPLVKELTLTNVYWNASANPGLQTIGSDHGNGRCERAGHLRTEIQRAGQRRQRNGSGAQGRRILAAGFEPRILGNPRVRQQPPGIAQAA